MDYSKFNFGFKIGNDVFLTDGQKKDGLVIGIKYNLLNKTIEKDIVFEKQKKFANGYLEPVSEKERFEVLKNISSAKEI